MLTKFAHLIGLLVSYGMLGGCPVRGEAMIYWSVIFWNGKRNERRLHFSGTEQTENLINTFANYLRIRYFDCGVKSFI